MMGVARSASAGSSHGALRMAVVSRPQMQRASGHAFRRRDPRRPAMGFAWSSASSCREGHGRLTSCIGCSKLDPLPFYAQ